MQDVQSVRELYPKIGDSKSLRDIKVKQVLDLISEISDIGTGGTDTGKKEQQSVPVAGEIQDGYRFKGGNPSDQNNWEKIE